MIVLLELRDFTLTKFFDGVEAGKSKGGGASGLHPLMRKSAHEWGTRVRRPASGKSKRRRCERFTSHSCARARMNGAPGSRGLASGKSKRRRCERFTSHSCARARMNGAPGVGRPGKARGGGASASHSCAKCAHEWGTRRPASGKSKRRRCERLTSHSCARARMNGAPGVWRPAKARGGGASGLHPTHAQERA